MNQNGFFRPPHAPAIPFPPPPFPPGSDPNFCFPFPNPGFPPPMPWFASGQVRSTPPQPSFAQVSRNLTPLSTQQPHSGNNLHIPCANSIGCQEDLDLRWIRNFVQNCRYNNDKIGKREVQSHQQRVVKISEAKKLHEQAYSLLRRLEEIGNGDLVETNKLKDELDGILSILNDEKTLASLALQVQRRMKKRRRLKQKKQEWYLERKEQENVIKQKHKEADDWIQKRREDQEDQKREEQVQKDLDDYLKEVRQKQSDLKKSLDLINALSKLHKARKESAARKGMAPPEELNEAFLSMQSSARDHILACMSTCEEEEKKLRIYLAEETKREEEKIRKEKIEQKEAHQAELIKDRERVLFGKKVTLDVMDPIWPIQQLHLQSSSNLVALSHARQQWDQFISDSGSRIPSGWVEPVMPSCEEWKMYLEEPASST